MRKKKQQQQKTCLILKQRGRFFTATSARVWDTLQRYFAACDVTLFLFNA